MRQASAVVGGATVDWKRFSTRRDNLLLVYPAGAPPGLARLKRALTEVDDASSVSNFGPLVLGAAPSTSPTHRNSLADD
jgi:hypothetical protein